MVAVAVPFSVYTTWLSGSIFLFNRKPGIDRDLFTKFCDKNMKLRPASSLIVYPEGTRNTKLEPLKLKTGVLTVAWNLKLPVQAVVTTNKEKCLNEKKFKYYAGVDMTIHVSKVIKPGDFNTQQEWFTACSDLFDDCWKCAYKQYPASEAPLEVKSLPLPPMQIPSREPLLPQRLLISRAIMGFFCASIAFFIYHAMVF